jgi:hypothetical protein
MAKGFHYFKFIATEWLTGDIVFEDFELQGIFINVCALYWHRDGKLTVDEIEKRLKTQRIANLTDRFISVNDGYISIKFLDEQLIEAGHISKTNSDNGKKGGRPKKETETKPTANRPQSDRKANESQIEIELELEKKKLKEIENRKLAFSSTLKPFLDKYGKEMLNDFYKYWTEPNKSNTKFRMELEKTWSLERRLEVWAKNDFGKKKEETTAPKYKLL